MEYIFDITNNTIYATNINYNTLNITNSNTLPLVLSVPLKIILLLFLSLLISNKNGRQK